MENEEVLTFYNSLFHYSTIALISKQTRVTKRSATIIDNVITTNMFHEYLKKGIIKSDISDHSPIFCSISASKSRKNSSPLKLIKRIFNKDNITSFKDQVSNINLENLNSTQCSASNFYETFLNIFIEVYDVNFLLTEIEIKHKISENVLVQ